MVHIVQRVRALHPYYGFRSVQSEHISSTNTPQPQAGNVCQCHSTHSIPHDSYAFKSTFLFERHHEPFSRQAAPQHITMGSPVQCGARHAHDTTGPRSQLAIAFSSIFSTYRINTKYWAAANIGPGPATPTNIPS